MKKIYCLIIISAIMLLDSCSMDTFLFNEKQASEYKLPGNTIPLAFIDTVSFMSGGNKLYGFFVGSEGVHPGVTMLYFHGNKYGIDEYWDRVMYMHKIGINVFIFDYKGFGRSEGASSKAGLHEDALAALNFILEDPRVNRDSICFMGYSLGNVPAIWLAANKFKPLVLISESPFASANSLTQAGSGLDLPPLWLTEGSFDNLAEIKKVHSPYLLIHGEADDFVRYKDNGKLVFEAAPNPKKLLLVPGAGHTDIPAVMGTSNYIRAISDWIFR